MRRTLTERGLVWRRSQRLAAVDPEVAPFAKRVWELRGAVTAYDAWYVALAETLELPLATLDRRLASANGPRCEFVVPD